MEPSNPAPEAQRSARRRLVRGVFAAPAVLALYSGSAAAMASNLRCVNNQVDAGRRAFPPPRPTADQYVRVQLWSLTDSSSTPPTVRWFLRGNDLQALTMGRSTVYNTFLQPGEWWEFDPAAEALVGTSPTTGDPSPGALAHNGAYVAVRINADAGGAGIVGVVDATHRNALSGSAVSGLCWASFVTAAR